MSNSPSGGYAWKRIFGTKSFWVWGNVLKTSSLFLSRPIFLFRKIFCGFIFAEIRVCEGRRGGEQQITLLLRPKITTQNQMGVVALAKEKRGEKKDKLGTNFPGKSSSFYSPALRKSFPQNYQLFSSSKKMHLISSAHFLTSPFLPPFSHTAPLPFPP